MKYLLDTNICIHYLRGNFSVDKKIEELHITEFAISEITLAELVYGAENSPNPKKNNLIVEAFTSQIAILPIYDAIQLYGKEKARLRKTGTIISDFDLLIGCTSVEKSMIMVTENIREFQKIANIKIENWVNRSKHK